MGHFMFGTTLNLTTTPSTRTSATIWRHVPAYLAPDADNRIHDLSRHQGRCCTSPSGQQFPIPSLSLPARQHELTRILERTTTSSVATSGTSSTTSSSRQHAQGRTIIISDPVYGRIFARIEAILPEQAFPPNGVNDWTLLRHEDAPSGEGVCHTSNGGPPT